MALLVAAGWLKPVCRGAGLEQSAFEAKSMDEAMKAFGGGVGAGKDVVFVSTPDIAENGAVVPISITSSIPGGVDRDPDRKNPNMLAAASTSAGHRPAISTRVKMGQTSNVYAGEGGRQVFHRLKEIKVTLGGCGG